MAHLSDGRWHKLSALAVELGYARREVEALVEELRKDGAPIVGGTFGVRLSTDPVEVRAYAEARRDRIAAIAVGTAALLRTAERMEYGDGSLGLWDDEPEPMPREGLPEFNGAFG